MEPKLIEHPSYVTNKESRKATTPTSPAFPRATPNLTCVWKSQTIKEHLIPSHGLLTTGSALRKHSRCWSDRTLRDLKSSEPRILLGFLSSGTGSSALSEWFPTSKKIYFLHLQA